MDSVKLIVLTDLHLLPAGREIIGIDPLGRLKAAVAHVKMHHADAAHVVFTGDLTHRGDIECYVGLRDCLARLGIPFTLMLGNHDRREAFASVFPDCLGHDGFVQSVVDLADFRLIALDTRGGSDAEGNVGWGELCQRRLAWLDRRLGEARGRKALLFMHHPPQALGFPGMDAIRLRDEDAFFEIVRRHGNVGLIVAGHIHRTISGTAHGIPFAIFKSTVHQMPMDLASRDASLSVAEPPAYGILLLTPTSIVVHTDDFA